MTIGILSWGAPETLDQTLKSYQDYNLPLYDNDRIIFFQELKDDDFRVAQKYGWMPFGSKNNVGIAEGYRALVEAAEGDTFLFLENDWRLIENPSAALSDGRYLLSTGDADIIRYRHRKNPGNPLWTRQFEGNEYAGKTHLLDSVHWTDPSKFDEVTKDFIYKREWFLTTSKHANWTNNPHMGYTKFLIENVLPRIGSGNLEGALQGWWEQQDFKVAQGDGLFTHDRLD